VIASRIGGIPHLWKTAQTDCSSTRAKLHFVGLRRRGGHPERAHALADGGKKAREHYDWDVIADRVIGVYEDAIRENSLRQ
jgi:hypothetical protein